MCQACLDRPTPGRAAQTIHCAEDGCTYVERRPSSGHASYPVNGALLQLVRAGQPTASADVTAGWQLVAMPAHPNSLLQKVDMCDTSFAATMAQLQRRLDGLEASRQEEVDKVAHTVRALEAALKTRRDELTDEVHASSNGNVQQVRAAVTELSAAMQRVMQAASELESKLSSSLYEHEEELTSATKLEQAMGHFERRHQAATALLSATTADLQLGKLKCSLAITRQQGQDGLEDAYEKGQLQQLSADNIRLREQLVGSIEDTMIVIHRAQSEPLEQLILLSELLRRHITLSRCVSYALLS